MGKLDPVKLGLGALGAAYLDARYSIGQDQHKGNALLRTELAVTWAKFRDRISLFYSFEDQCRKRPNAIAYQCEGSKLTWAEAEIESRRIAHYLLSRGLQRGDIVSVYMPNKTSYLLLVAACFSIDVVPALINVRDEARASLTPQYNLTGKGLQHCISVAGSKMIIFDAELEASIAEIVPELGALQYTRWQDQYSGQSKRSVDVAQTIDASVLAKQSTEYIGHERRSKIDFQSPALMIYTSGTTGLPKAAICSHGRVGFAANIWWHVNSITSKDIIFCPMPFYHSTALFLCVFMSWRSGATVAIGRKFSATRFWDEVRQNDATVIQYVGEIGRYLLAVPPSPRDKEHRVRMAYGNGMRPDVVPRFRERFGVQTISEFFASTEGNLSLFNVNTNDFGIGAVGSGGLLYRIRRRGDEAIIRVDALTEEPERDSKGFCIRCSPDEPGELISAIDPTSPFKAFRGYHGNEEATKKKVLTNVFKKGDAWFRTGDLLKRDRDGFIYFGDRLGDTFRWRSENVSTQDVAAALGEVIDECAVYGTLVPGHDGRAGCAAIPKSAPVDLVVLARHVSKRLPRYAQPVFLRMVTSLETTGTNKHQKVKLRNEGIDPAQTKADEVYVLKAGSYQRFTPDDWKMLSAGKLKL